MSAHLDNITRMSAERLEEALAKDEIKPRDLPLALCQLMDKKLLLDGEATARLEVRAGEPTFDSVNRKLKELLDSLPELDAEVVEQTRPDESQAPRGQGQP
jgi:hypothetical protein